jgi:hypothetical protein
MLKRLVFAALLLGSLGVAQSNAQLCTSTHTTDLYCLLPAAFHTTAAPFNAFYAPFGTELSQLPTAKPAGLILILDGGVLKPANESLGAVFSERAETVGKHRVFLGFTYQRFNFSSIDGNDLGNLPIVLTFMGTTSNGTPVSVDTVTTNRIDLKSNQYTFLGTLGLNNRVDVSVSIPSQRISMSASVSGTEYDQIGGGIAPIPTEYVPGSSFGIGDVIVGAKGMVWQGENVRFAVGTDFRIPSGNELNFLGSGTIGIKPYVAISRRGKVSPHGNLGYQWNGNSILNPSSQGDKQRLPTDLFYTAGMDATLKRVTVIADLLGQIYFNAPRLSKPVPTPVKYAPGTPISVQHYVGNYAANNLGLGVKGQVFGHLVLTGNLLVKLDSAGLRSTVVPLAGISYSF